MGVRLQKETDVVRDHTRRVEAVVKDNTEKLQRIGLMRQAMVDLGTGLASLNARLKAFETRERDRWVQQWVFSLFVYF